MSECEQAPADPAADRGLSLDRPANDLVRLGTDTNGHNHYWDRPSERILVVDATHEQYTRGIHVYHRLAVEPGAVVHVQETGPTDDPAAWIEFIEAAEDYAWDGDTVEIIDLSDLLPAGGVP